MKKFLFVVAVLMNCLNVNADTNPYKVDYMKISTAATFGMHGFFGNHQHVLPNEELNHVPIMAEQNNFQNVPQQELGFVESLIRSWREDPRQRANMKSVFLPFLLASTLTILPIAQWKKMHGEYNAKWDLAVIASQCCASFIYEKVVNAHLKKFYNSNTKINQVSEKWNKELFQGIIATGIADGIAHLRPTSRLGICRNLLDKLLFIERRIYEQNGLVTFLLNLLVSKIR